MNAPEPTHTKLGTAGGGTIVRHPSQIEREKRETAYMLNILWPSICADEPTPDSTQRSEKCLKSAQV
jgi:hypothetical protein